MSDGMMVEETVSKVSLKGAIADEKIEHSEMTGHFSLILMFMGKQTGPKLSQSIYPNFFLNYIFFLSTGSFIYLIPFDSFLNNCKNLSCC